MNNKSMNNESKNNKPLNNSSANNQSASSNSADADFSLILASSVHDMKNSVGMLLASLEEFIAESEPQSDQQGKRLATLQYEASRISGELIQLLSIYRMQGNRLPVHIEEQFISDVLEDQVARNDMLFQTRNLTVNIDCDHDLRWFFDGELIGGVIHNVLVNCARYTKNAIELSATIDNDVLCITVADNGGGYPKMMLEEPVSEDAGVDFQSGSTHLGLYFAGKVAAMHTQNDKKGTIKLENGGKLGGGMFKLYLP